jgi:hypothetical protein
VTFSFLASVPEASEPAIGSGWLVGPGAEEAAWALWFLAALLLPQAPVSALSHLPALAAGSRPVLALPGSMADAALKLDLA